MSKQTIFTKMGFRFLIRAFVDLKDIFTTEPVEKGVPSGKRILIFNWRDTKHAFAGGAEVYIHELAKRWVQAGDSVTLFCGSDGRSKRNETIDGVRIFRRGGFYFVYLWAFLYYMLKFRGNYDVLIDCENGIPFFTPLYTREKKFLVIHHVHQEVFLTSLRRPFSDLAQFLEMKLMPFVYRNIQIITVSESSKKDILAHGITKIEPIVIHNGIDHERYTPGKKAASPLVVYLGRLKQYKNIPVFLQAAKRIRTVVPDARFIIGGDGEEMRSLKKLAKQLGLTERVTFTGKVSEAEKIALYKKAWVFVNPSLREGWGITTIEANACGTPVVASNVPGLRDSVKNPYTGYLVPFGNANAFAVKILTLLADTKRRRAMSREARNWAMEFSWNVSADRFSELMDKALRTEQQKAHVLAGLKQNIAYGEVQSYEK
jgi:glycosyltransferase involved in cell wall biosynthesis